jgi:hypothetical protein
MKHIVNIIFGKEQILKFQAHIPFSKDEKEIHEREYHFGTQMELDAFLKGVNETVGWLECHIVEDTPCKV